MHDQSNEPFANVTDNLDERKPASMPDLPPVEPPSAGFVVQLFVIPAVVVVVVIVVWLLFGKLAGGERDAMEYVRQLRSPTANWRLAFELANRSRKERPPRYSRARRRRPWDDREKSPA